MFGRRRNFAPARHLSPKHVVKIRRVSDVSVPAAVDKIDLIKKAGVSFEKKVESAVKVNMSKGGANNNVRWSVVCLIDESYSMDQFFYDGTVQEITERFLAWAATKDSDGMAPVGAFGSGHVWHEEVDLSNVVGIVNAKGWAPWGSTNLAASLQAILDMIRQMGDGWEYDPILLGIVTDGRPDNMEAVKQLVCELSQYAVLIKILRLGNDPYAKQFTDYLDDMEDHSPGSRLFDNVDCPKQALYKGMPDDKFNEDMTAETDSSVNGMIAAGVLVEG
jgi:hypothetical protein